MSRIRKGDGGWMDGWMDAMDGGIFHREWINV